MVRINLQILLILLAAYGPLSHGRPPNVGSSDAAPPAPRPLKPKTGSVLNDPGPYDNGGSPPPPYPPPGDGGDGSPGYSGPPPPNGGGGGDSGGYSGGGSYPSGGGYPSGSGSGYSQPPPYPPGGYYGGASSNSFSFSSSSSGGGGGYAPPYGGGYNPFQYLFDFWHPPYLHKGGGLYITNCIGCKNYADAVGGSTNNLTLETACVGYIEQNVEQPKKPKDLAVEVSKLQKTSPNDPSSLILQCCHREYKNKLFPADEAAHLSYPQPEGLQNGKSCKDVVKSFFKLMTNDYPHPPVKGNSNSTATISTKPK